MADAPQPAPTPEQPKKWWEVMLKRFEKHAEAFAIAGGLGYIIWALAENEECQEVFLKAIRFGQNLLIEMQEIYNGLRRGILAVLAIIAAWALWFIYTSLKMEQLYYHHGINWWDTLTHSRGGLLVTSLILYLLLVDLELRVLPALLGADALRKKFNQAVKGEGFTAKMLRVVGKLKGWISLGVAGFIIAPFWHKPELAWIATILIIPYIPFLNAWEPGKLEKFRRTMIWFIGLTQINCFMMAVLGYPLLIAAKAYQSPYAPTLLNIIVAFIWLSWLAQSIFAIWSGCRNTAEDKARAIVTPFIAVKQTLDQNNMSVDEAAEVRDKLHIPTPDSRQSARETHHSQQQVNQTVASQEAPFVDYSPWPGIIKTLLVIAVPVLIWLAFFHTGILSWSTEKTAMLPWNWVNNAPLTGTWIAAILFIVVVALGGIFLMGTIFTRMRGRRYR